MEDKGTKVNRRSGILGAIRIDDDVGPGNGSCTTAPNDRVAPQTSQRNGATFNELYCLVFIDQSLE